MVNYFPTSYIENGDCHIIPKLSMLLYIKQYSKIYYKMLLEYGFIPASKIDDVPSIFNEKTVRLTACCNQLLFDSERLKNVNLKRRINMFLYYY